MTSLFGHDGQEQSVLKAFNSRKMHHGWLLTGSQGVGKASFAWLAAQHIVSREANDGFEKFTPDHVGAAGAMLEAHNHPDIHYIGLEPKDDKERRNQENGKPFETRRNITVDQVRRLQQRLNSRPSLSERRAIIIDSVDNMERSAANALLKSLEEPPQNTYFFLISHNPGKLLPTIRSRCLTLIFSALNDDDMRKALNTHDESISDSEMASLLALGAGSPGHALQFNALGMDSVHTLMQKIVDTGDRSQALRLQLCKALIGKANKEKLAAFIDYAPVFAAQISRDRRGKGLSAAVTAWEELVKLAEQAPTYNFTPETLVYQIGGLLARLAPPREAAA